MERKGKNVWWKLGHIRSVYLSLTLIALFIVAMFGLPKPAPKSVSLYVQKTYDLIDSMEPGSVAFFQCSNDYAWYVTHIPGAIGMMKHAIDKKIKIIELETSNEGTMIFSYVILPALLPRMEEMGYEYGKDWVKLGYVAGGDAAYKAFCDDPRNIGTDVFGNDIEDLPLFDEVKSGADIDIILFTGYGLHGAIRQIVSRYDTPMVACSHAGGLQWFFVFLQTGQLDGFIHGWSGGREYEYLIGEPALGTFGSMAVSVGFYLCIAGIVIANIAFVGMKLFGEDKK